jgi:hypothetical protein
MLQKVFLHAALIATAISTIANELNDKLKQTPGPIDKKLEEQAMAQIEPLNRESWSVCWRLSASWKIRNADCFCYTPSPTRFKRHALTCLESFGVKLTSACAWPTLKRLGR